MEKEGFPIPFNYALYLCFLLNWRNLFKSHLKTYETW